MAFPSFASNGLLFAAFAAGALTLAACSHDQTLAELHDPDEPTYGIFYNDNGETASLAYGEASSDNVSLMLECAKGSGRVQVSDLARGQAPSPLVLASGGRTSELGGRLEAGDGPAVVIADAGVDAQALQKFRSTGRLTVAQGADRYGVAASAAERQEIGLFFTACGQAA